MPGVGGISFAAARVPEADDEVVAQDVLLGIGVCIIVFHKVIYKKNSSDFM